jgi:predicted small secreted protein
MTTSLSSTGPQIIRNDGSKKLPKIQSIMSFVLFLWCGETTGCGTAASKGQDIDLPDD